tara:strand:+ start:2730 stop:3425 length:696 start_codon:yes stop_codon:yes gene_type:complete
MAIDVICSGCLKQFQVSDQYAGRSGPCPGCKTIISIPKLEDQLVIEEPKYKPGSSGAHTKIDGIRRRAGFFQRLEVITLCSIFGAAAVLALVIRILQTDHVTRLNLTTGVLFGIGLILLSLGSSALGYGILKDVEIEAFPRRSTIVRSIITSIFYCLIASGFIASTLFFTQDDPRTLILAVIGIACFSIASFVPAVFFEMELMQGALHVSIMICMTSLFCLLANNYHQWLL